MATNSRRRRHSDFLALAPDYDLTFTRPIFSQQGFFAKRMAQRLESGSYFIRATGISSKTPLSSQSLPMIGSQSARGSLESRRFYIADEWKFGWNSRFFRTKCTLTTITAGQRFHTIL